MFTAKYKPDNHALMIGTNALQSYVQRSIILGSNFYCNRRNHEKYRNRRSRKVKTSTESCGYYTHRHSWRFCQVLKCPVSVSTNVPLVSQGNLFHFLIAGTGIKCVSTSSDFFLFASTVYRLSSTRQPVIIINIPLLSNILYNAYCFENINSLYESFYNNIRYLPDEIFNA